MCSKPENTNKLESDSHGITSSTICSQPWWHGRFNAAPPGVLEDRTLKSSVEPLENGMANKTSKSQGDVINEADGVNKQMQSTVEQQSDGNYGPEQLQQVASTIPAAGSEYGASHPQLELIGHSIGCAPYPYSDPYYGGLITAYGTQALVNPHIVGMPHTRMPLPLQMAEEPVYVNAKQYHGIIRRRESRAKAELERKLIKVRKPYLHESRHQHALRRARGCGGRFLNTKKQSDGTNATSKKGMDSEPKSSAINSSDGRQEVNGFIRHEMHEQYAHPNGDDKNNSSYQHHQGFRMSVYHSLPGERGDEGDCSGQQRGSISVNQARHRALAIQ